MRPVSRSWLESGGAYAAGTPPRPGTAAKPADHAAEQKAFLDDVAKRLNVTRDQLDAAIKGAAEARIDAAVAAGKLTKEQGDEAKKRLASGAAAARRSRSRRRAARRRRARLRPRRPGRFGTRRLRARRRGDLPRPERGRAAHAAAEAGKSLADVAKAQNKDVAGLKAAMKAAITKQLDQAVKDRKLTAGEKTKILADVDERLDDIINSTRAEGRPATAPSSAGASATRRSRERRGRREHERDGVAARRHGGTVAATGTARSAASNSRASRAVSQRQRITSTSLSRHGGDAHVAALPELVAVPAPARRGRVVAAEQLARLPLAPGRRAPRAASRAPSPTSRRTGSGVSTCDPLLRVHDLLGAVGHAHAVGEVDERPRAAAGRRSAWTNCIPPTYGKSSWSWRNGGRSGPVWNAAPSSPPSAFSAPM